MAGHPPPAGMDAAFHAAWGSPPPVVVMRAPAGGADEVPLAVVPVTLQLLGGRRYALVSKEVNPGLYHAAAGAVSIAYLDWNGHAWRRVGDWPDIAWAGESGGGDLKAEVRRDLGPVPLLLVSGSHLGQGYLDGTTVTVQLTHDAPRALGRIPIFAGNADVGPGSGALESFFYRSTIGPAPAPALFDVRYDGWTQPKAGAAKRQFHARARFVIRDGCLAIEAPMTLPGERSSPAPADCPKATGWP